MMGLLYQECVNVSYWSLIWTKIDQLGVIKTDSLKNFSRKTLTGKHLQWCLINFEKFSITLFLWYILRATASVWIIIAKTIGNEFPITWVQGCRKIINSYQANCIKQTLNIFGSKQHI